MINREDYNLEDMDEDEQIHVNHIDCPAGEDRKQRLYIRRVENGYLYYCHHCGTNGILPNSRSSAASLRKRFNTSGKKSGSSKPCGKAVTTPRSAINIADRALWPRDALTWVRQYGISREEMQSYGILYDPDSRRVVLPWRHGHDICIYQTRRIFPDPESPKYKTYCDKSNLLLDPAYGGDGSILVLCEDILSAIKIARQADALPILGTGISTEQTAYLSLLAGKRRWKAVLIWLDDDNRYVKREQLLLKNKLEVLLGDIVHVVHSTDPKHMEDCDIERILNKYK